MIIQSLYFKQSFNLKLLKRKNARWDTIHSLADYW